MLFCRARERRSEMAEEKKKGWHSRRHETSRENGDARAAYQKEHGPEARQRKADEREETRDARSPREQLGLLDQRLGVGIGARRERARLQAQIDAN